MASLSLSAGPFLTRSCASPRAHPAFVAQLRRESPKVRPVATTCVPSAATEGETLAALAARREERVALREEREAHLAADAAARAALREEREAALAERLATLAETKEKREEKFAESTAASASKGAESSAKAAFNGERVAIVSAVGVGATLFLAFTMLVPRGMPPG